MNNGILNQLLIYSKPSYDDNLTNFNDRKFRLFFVDIFKYYIEICDKKKLFKQTYGDYVYIIIYYQYVAKMDFAFKNIVKKNITEQSIVSIFT